MRTNIDIDDNLMREAMRSGARTKRAVVEEGLRLLIRTRDQRAIRRLRGKVAWRRTSRRDRKAPSRNAQRRHPRRMTLWVAPTPLTRFRDWPMNTPRFHRPS
jgi:Arc/MetJ family transcription regulator